MFIFSYKYINVHFELSSDLKQQMKRIVFVSDRCVNVDDQMWRPEVKSFELSFTEDIRITSGIQSTANSGGKHSVEYKEEFLHAVIAPQDVVIL